MPHTQYSPSCTISSMTNTTSLKLRDYQIDTTAEGNRLFSFTLFNPGPGDAYRLYRIPFLDGGGTWHECKDGPLGSVPIGGPVKIPWQLERCQYIIDSQHKKISVAVQWFCDDRDPINAYVFSPSARTKLHVLMTNRILFRATATAELPAEVCTESKPPAKAKSLTMVDGRVRTTTSSLPGDTKTCRLTADASEVDMEVLALDWITTMKPMERGPVLPWV